MSASRRLPLRGVRVLNLAPNLPGPLVAARLRGLGATVTKVEPPAGDPFESICPEWYRAMIAGQRVLKLDLKDGAAADGFLAHLRRADLLITSSRPSALRRLGLGWRRLQTINPRLSHLAIVGHAAPDDEVAGHDLTYQASAGLVRPPLLPPTLLADMVTAERGVAEALALLVRRSPGARTVVAMSEVVDDILAPLRYGLTAPGALLGGGSPEYGLYETADGWIALAALEARFKERLQALLGVPADDRDALQAVFARSTAREWEDWAAQHDIPLRAVRMARDTEAQR